MLRDIHAVERHVVGSKVQNLQGLGTGSQNEVTRVWTYSSLLHSAAHCQHCAEVTSETPTPGKPRLVWIGTRFTDGSLSQQPESADLPRISHHCWPFGNNFYPLQPLHSLTVAKPSRSKPLLLFQAIDHLFGLATQTKPLVVLRVLWHLPTWLDADSEGGNIWDPNTMW